MTTIINTPSGGTSDSDSGLGLIVGALVAVGIIVLFFVYGLPALRNNQVDTQQPGSTNINVTLPDSGSTTPPSTTTTP